MFHNFIFLPLYNGLVAIMELIPGIDLGLAVIIFTIVVRFILFPLSKSALLTQVKMKEIEPQAAKIRVEYANNKQEQALKVMELYRTNKVRPFSGILLLFIQLPILFALLSVFYKIIPEIDPANVYEFLKADIPIVKDSLFGLSLTSKNIILSLITAGAQFLQMKYSIATRQQKEISAIMLKNGQKMDTATSISNSMNTQMKYFLPILAFVSVYFIIPAKFPQAASIIAIYWSVSALFTLVQELYISKKYIKTAK